MSGIKISLKDLTMSSKLKIYSDKRYLQSVKDTRPILMPFWGWEEDRTAPNAGRFDKWMEEGKDVLQMVSLEEADVAVYPMDPTIDRAGFKRFWQETGDKTLVAFFNSDSDEVLSYRKGVYIFRTSFYKSSQRKTEFAVPGWSEDWGAFKPNVWKKRPIVGFCGQIHRPRARSTSLVTLEGNKNIKTNFIKKKAFWGGWISGGKKPQEGRKLRNEFVQNINESDYIVCARGGGNFSYRIYETLMSGRIPIFIDTDSVLPYDFIVDWEKEFPIVKESDMNSLSRKVTEFHNSIKDNFKEHQLRMRSLWEEWISPTGFFTNFHKHFER